MPSLHRSFLISLVPLLVAACSSGGDGVTGSGGADGIVCISEGAAGGHATIDDTPDCDPTRDTLGAAPSAYFSAAERTLYVLAWDRRDEVIAALHGEMVGPEMVLLQVGDSSVEANLAPMRSGPTELDGGLIVPHEPKKEWDPKRPPVFGDVVIHLDHECRTTTLWLACTRGDFRAQPGAPWQQGWLSWANGRNEKMYGYCRKAPGKVCTTVYTDAGDIDAYADAACTQKIATFGEGLWVCLDL